MVLRVVSEVDGTFIIDAETHGGFVPKMSARWSDHYVHNPRTPEDTELAWWVRKSTMMKGSAD